MPAMTSSIAAVKAGSVTRREGLWMRTASPAGCLKPASRILSIRPDSPGPGVFGSMVFVPARPPRTKARRTNASQPNVAVFQWSALQRPMRAATFLGLVADMIFLPNVECENTHVSDARDGSGLAASSTGRIRPRPDRRLGVLLRLEAAGGEPAVRSARKPDRAARPSVRARCADRALDDRGHRRGRGSSRLVECSALLALVRDSGDRDHGAPGLRAPTFSVHGAGRVLAVGRSAVVCGRTPGLVHDQHLPCRDGRLVPSREPA